MSKRFLSTINLPKLASDPVSGSEGDIYYNTTSDKIKYYNGSTWEEVAGADEVFYQNSAPSSPTLGDIWIDADSDAIGTSLNIDLLLPSQTNNSGKYLTTNGTSASWGSISGFATTSALSSHESDTTNVHGITDTANIVLTNDARLSDSRTPTSHSASHGSAGSDPITIAQSQVTNLTTDLGAKAPLASPELTGVPTAPTATAATNTTQIATTAFVRTEISNLVDAAPTTLDTLNELAAALGDDPNYATTISTALGGKEPTITAGTTSQYWRGDKSWQTLDKSAVGLSNVENTALSTWAGSSSITTVGTITSGTWQGSSISSTYIDSAIARLASPTFTGTVVIPVSTNERTASYTLVLSDASKLIEMNVGSANTVTVPPNSSVAFPVGTKIDIIQTGAGETSFVAGSGVTLNSDGGKLKINAQWAAVSLVKRATDTWVLIGALKA